MTDESETTPATAPPPVIAPPSVDVPATIAVPAGLRLAGMILVLNGVAVIVEKMVLAGHDTVASQFSGVVDIVLGIALVGRNLRFLKWTQVRVVLGLVLFGGTQLLNHHPVMATIQVVFSLSLLNLLFGKPGTARRAASVVLALGMFSPEGLGLYKEFTGRDVLGRWKLEMQEKVSPLDPVLVAGVDYPYMIASPGAEWLQRTQESARKNNALADIWLVNPDYDAHVYVIGEQTDEGHVFVLDKMSESVISHIKKKAGDFIVIERRSVASSPGNGEHILGTGTLAGAKYTFHYGVFAFGHHGFQVVCSAKPKSFEHVAAACESMIESFSYPDKTGS